MKIDTTWTLFLDRDGVINRPKPPHEYIATLEEFALIDGALEALQKARDLFGRIVVVTNQRGVGRGVVSTPQVEDIHRHLLALTEEAGIKIDAIYYCPHLEECSCRKPKPGLAQAAQRDFPEIDFAKSVMVGNSASDMEFAKNLGMRAFLVGEEEVSEELYEKRFTDLYSFIHSFTFCPHKPGAGVLFAEAV